MNIGHVANYLYDFTGTKTHIIISMNNFLFVNICFRFKLVHFEIWTYLHLYRVSYDCLCLYNHMLTIRRVEI